MIVFVDTVILTALGSPRDQHHHQSQSILERLMKSNTHLVTTDYIIDETVTNLLTSRKTGYRNATNLLNWILGKDSPVELEWITRERFLRSTKVFVQYNKDKQWSFTDCTSFVLMKEKKIQVAFTFDDHFKEMGFSLLGEKLK